MFIAEEFKSPLNELSNGYLCLTIVVTLVAIWVIARNMSKGD